MNEWISTVDITRHCSRRDLRAASSFGESYASFKASISRRIRLVRDARRIAGSPPPRARLPPIAPRTPVRLCVIPGRRRAIEPPRGAPTPVAARRWTYARVTTSAPVTSRSAPDATPMVRPSASHATKKRPPSSSSSSSASALERRRRRDRVDGGDSGGDEHESRRLERRARRHLSEVRADAPERKGEERERGRGPSRARRRSTRR